MNDDGSTLLSEAATFVRGALGDRLDDVTLERVVFGLFFTGVKLSTGEGGLCFTPIKEIPEAVCCPSSARAMPLSGRLRGTPGSSMLEWLGSANPLKAALGIACLNALSEHCSAEGEHCGYPLGRGDAFDAVPVADFPKAVVVGALIPMLRRLKRSGTQWTVLEMDPATLKGEELEHYLPAERFGEVVPDADLLVITGVTVLNGALPGLMAAAKPGAEVIVTGPTVSMDPEPLFRLGVTVVGGLRVTDADTAMDVIAEGGSGYHLFGRSAEQTIVTPSVTAACRGRLVPDDRRRGG